MNVLQPFIEEVRGELSYVGRSDVKNEEVYLKSLKIMKSIALKFGRSDADALVAAFHPSDLRTGWVSEYIVEWARYLAYDMSFCLSAAQLFVAGRLFTDDSDGDGLSQYHARYLLWIYNNSAVNTPGIEGLYYKFNTLELFYQVGCLKMCEGVSWHIIKDISGGAEEYLRESSAIFHNFEDVIKEIRDCSEGVLKKNVEEIMAIAHIDPDLPQ